MSNTLKSLRTWLQQGSHSTWILFISFALLLFLKSILFHWAAYHSILISSLWKAPLSFYKFYMAKLLMPLLIASFLFVSKHRWWTIIVSLLVDIWCISNLIYFKTYDAFLTVNDILLVGNMDGAWSSVTAYIDWTMAVMLLLTIVWGCFCIPFSKTKDKRKWGILVLAILTINAFANLNNYFIYNSRFAIDQEEIVATQEWVTMAEAEMGNEKLQYIPFYTIYYTASNGDICGKAAWCEGYIRQQSVISFFIADIIYYVAYPNLAGEIITMEDSDIESVRSFISTDTVALLPSSSLIIILVESLESWPLEHDVENTIIAPNLRWLKEQNHILFCDKITSQTRGGNSGDGQMIVNTGLLPIQNGVACMNYGDNIYPSVGHIYVHATIINPWPHIWNQDTMSLRYGYNQMVEPHHTWNDRYVLDTTYHVMNQTSDPSLALAITLSMHSPFMAQRNRLSVNAPAILNRYMQCFNYTDSCIGAFMDKVLADPELSQSTIVITGDHTIFKSAMLTEFKDYAEAQNLSIASGENYCPLIIYSPQIEGNIHIDEVCYQMDIFPTILHLIGCEDYFWHGFGVNLLDENTRHNRPITEQEAYRLSDLMIRSDYFRQYMGK